MPSMLSRTQIDFIIIADVISTSSELLPLCQKIKKIQVGAAMHVGLTFFSRDWNRNNFQNCRWGWRNLHLRFPSNRLRRKQGMKKIETVPGGQRKLLQDSRPPTQQLLASLSERHLTNVARHQEERLRQGSTCTPSVKDCKNTELDTTDNVTCRMTAVLCKHELLQSPN